ncbi:MAG TPA: AgmX/PglI C-terminal domain-containing protein, partial [Pseudobdellovibrionaceae bacterium]|nr:AgmX/PglI C-terminal domain-containing protein [Pseudobdellovibrionaceae bacterium]
PVVENISPRFARLLVEPPKQVLAPPPPIEIKPVELPKPEPEKPEPPKPPEPKMVVKKEMQKPKPIAKPEKKLQKAPQVKPKEQPIEQAQTDKPQPQLVLSEETVTPQEEKINKSMQEMNDLFAEIPQAGGSKGPGSETPVKIAKSTTPGVGVLPKSLNSTSGSGSGSSTSIGKNPSLGLNVGSAGYQKTGTTSAAGKRSIKGAVVGIPSFKPKRTNQGLSNDEVMKIVNKALPKIQQCYERELFSDATLAGRVEYEWEINPTGKVIDINVKSSEMGRGDKLNDCVMGVIKALNFPIAKNGQSTVASIGFPFGKK